MYNCIINVYNLFILLKLLSAHFMVVILGYELKLCCKRNFYNKWILNFELCRITLY